MWTKYNGIWNSDVYGGGYVYVNMYVYTINDLNWFILCMLVDNLIGNNYYKD